MLVEVVVVVDGVVVDGVVVGGVVIYVARCGHTNFKFKSFFLSL